MTLTLPSSVMSAGQAAADWGFGGAQYTNETSPPFVKPPKVSSGELLQNPVEVTVGLLTLLYIPPPHPTAELL